MEDKPTTIVSCDKCSGCKYFKIAKPDTYIAGSITYGCEKIAYNKPCSKDEHYPFITILFSALRNGDIVCYNHYPFAPSRVSFSSGRDKICLTACNKNLQTTQWLTEKEFNTKNFIKYQEDLWGKV